MERPESSFRDHPDDPRHKSELFALAEPAKSSNPFKHELDDLDRSNLYSFTEPKLPPQPTLLLRELLELNETNRLKSQDIYSFAQQPERLEDEPEDESKAYKGLRSLSERVMDLVVELQRTTYKEVASVLVEELQKKEQKRSRQEQNVRRRVYDALNVLIAANILEKDGKNIFCKKPRMFGKVRCPVWEEYNQRAQQAQRERRRTNNLRLLLLKHRARLRSLKEYSESAGGQVESPVVLLVLNENESWLQHRRRPGGEEVVVQSSHRVEAVTDLDLLFRRADRQAESQFLREAKIQ